MWFQKTKWKLIAAICIIAVLAAAFCFGGDAPDSSGRSTGAPSAPTESAVADSSKPMSEVSPGQAQETDASTITDTPEKDTDRPIGAGPTSEEVDPPVADPKPTPESASEARPAPETASKPTPEAQEPICTISISCETILSNMEFCDPNKAELVPENGWILGPLTVAFTEGESVFDILQRVCRADGIHLEFVDTPAYGSVYIEGISNLYEFDVGELSGWMYKVNGWFPNYGCSQYEIKNGDEICWVYTCDQGADVGGGLS